MANYKLTVNVLLFCVFISACKKDDATEKVETSPPEVTTPEGYEFIRNGNSSVNYQGQIDRLNQLAEMKSYMLKAHAGEVIDEDVLFDMFENKNGNANGAFSFQSTKQLKDKTFNLDVAWFQQLLVYHAAASKITSTATNGTAGLLSRSNGSKILVDPEGKEFVQLFEKGIMGATFLNQIFNTYLTDEKIGDNIENTLLEEDKNYTALEHHFDEAFGYFGAPTDFKSDYQGTGVPRFLASYSNELDVVLGCNDIIMDAFIKGRAAIVANDMQAKNEQKVILYEQLEKLAAAVAIHYANEALSETNDGDRLHLLSECYAFIRALRYQNFAYRKLSQQEVDQLLNQELGENFWETTESGLKNIKNKLSTVYGLEAEKDVL